MTTKTIILMALILMLIFIIFYYLIQSSYERKAIIEAKRVAKEGGKREEKVKRKALKNTTLMLLVEAIISTGALAGFNIGVDTYSVKYGALPSDSGGGRIEFNVAENLIGNFGKRKTKSIFFSEDVFNSMKQYGINDPKLQKLTKDTIPYKFGFSLVFGKYNDETIKAINEEIKMKNRWANNRNTRLGYTKYEEEDLLNDGDKGHETLIAYPTIVWDTINNTGDTAVLDKVFHIIENKSEKKPSDGLKPISYNIGSLCPDNCPLKIDKIIPDSLVIK